MAIVLCAIAIALLVPAVSCCTCMISNVTNQICQADFVGTVLLKSRQNDAVNMLFVYQGEIDAVFRANFDIPPDNNKTTVITAENSAACGMPLAVQQDTAANTFFMATSHFENSISINLCGSLICRWKDIGETFQQKLSKDYVAKACACKWDDESCISTYNFEFMECARFDLTDETKP